LLLITNQEIAYVVSDEDHRPWMILKFTDNQYGRLS